ncbi:glutamine amidotransferase [Anaerosolibacter carboniphilus]|uniref:Imidazole glycerol phosphate synthase subunit HisH n=1 Tax=Anaerosolibacter carboniphilus TaxID=1417629 RepID=A0A841KXL6_9FIRM|nr:imidazole glycerol phosphate synthase subunit HisH [Anaerosolibacter carboniphilus]MBB6215672.1 glutamine amidotransferase [Anaerosolibacter carboniphilus]
MIAIVDYGVGNLKSVDKAFQHLGFRSIITSDKEEIDKSDAIVLPGVGAFKDAMEQLKKNDLVECIKKNGEKKKWILGICLGMQLLYEKSYEDGEWEGLGLLKGEIVKFSSHLKIPHMGWNRLLRKYDDELGRNIHEGEYVYFVHSYYLQTHVQKDILFSTQYDVEVPAVVRNGNIIGMQFHPEKSGDTGLKLLKNFGELIK